jgi:alpha-galactosidase
MTNEEDRAHMTLWCLLAAPLIAGNDLTRMNSETRSILTNPELIAVDQDRAGMQGRRISEVGPLGVWMKPLADGSKAVGLFNREQGTLPISVSFREIGLGKAACVRDLWGHKNLGRFQGTFTADVPQRGAEMILASDCERADKQHPSGVSRKPHVIPTR